jgi:hypothetical protein
MYILIGLGLRAWTADTRRPSIPLRGSAANPFGTHIRCGSIPRVGPPPLPYPCNAAAAVAPAAAHSPCQAPPVARCARLSA